MLYTLSALLVLIVLIVLGIGLYHLFFKKPPWKRKKKGRTPYGISHKYLRKKDELLTWFQKRNCCPDCGNEYFRKSQGWGHKQICTKCGATFAVGIPLFVYRIKGKFIDNSRS